MTKRTTALPSRRTPAQSWREYFAGPPKVGQRAVAEAAGCHQSMISMLARGKRVPSARLAVRLHMITGIPLKVLLTQKLRKVRHKVRPTSRGDPSLPAQAVP
jgi:transcriptional regulator with XRE-family HTH domain